MLRATVDGDASGGWMVEIHDGDRVIVSSPRADTPQDALRKAIEAEWPSEPLSLAGEMVPPGPLGDEPSLPKSKKKAANDTDRPDPAD